MLEALDLLECDLIFPIYQEHSQSTGKNERDELVALVLVSDPSYFDEWNFSLGFYSRVFEALQEVGNALGRLRKIEAAKEKERLVVLGEMAAGLAHEVRNPLGAIRGAAELLGPESNPWARVIHEEVNRLNRLVSQFLDFANPTTDVLEVCNLVEVVERTLKHTEPMFHKKAEILLVCPEPLVFVKAVPDHIQQVLLNLLQNALKAVEGKPHPTIEVHVLPNGVFRVKDHGIGISEENLKKVFQPFYTSFKDGTGLGLAICARLVYFNEGKISVESELGKGTEVTVQLTLTEKNYER